jgi:hypothetical protein
MASKLSLYNSANLILGERKLTSLSENRPSRRRLDTWWDADGVLECLQAGLWNHAMRTVSLTYSPSVTPAFAESGGYQYAFDIPEDYVRMALVSDDAGFCNIRTDYVIEGDYIQANCQTIYLKYVSSDSAFGMDLSKWPPKFTDYVAHAAAHKVCKATTNSNTDKDQIGADLKKALNSSRSIDAMDEAPRQIPAGSWSRARRGNGASTNDLGNPGRLIG